MRNVASGCENDGHGDVQGLRIAGADSGFAAGRAQDGHFAFAGNPRADQQPEYSVDGRDRGGASAAGVDGFAAGENRVSRAGKFFAEPRGDDKQKDRRSETGGNRSDAADAAGARGGGGDSGGGAAGAAFRHQRRGESEEHHRAAGYFHAPGDRGRRRFRGARAAVRAGAEGLQGPALRGDRVADVSDYFAGGHEADAAAIRARQTAGGKRQRAGATGRRAGLLRRRRGASEGDSGRGAADVDRPAGQRASERGGVQGEAELPGGGFEQGRRASVRTQFWEAITAPPSRRLVLDPATFIFWRRANGSACHRTGRRR